MKKRDLSAEEQAAWDEARSAAKPMRGKKPPPDVMQKNPPESEVKPLTPTRPQKPRITAATALKRDDFRALDKATSARFKGGKIPIDTTLDLHGLKASDAQQRTHHFITAAAARGDRVVLIITGKGQRGEGVIRRELPHWLEAPALRPFILAMTYARPEEGGEGAYRILLRRQRK
jgi:DNA-nicking Smr family endonuclease